MRFDQGYWFGNRTGCARSRGGGSCAGASAAASGTATSSRGFARATTTCWCRMGLNYVIQCLINFTHPSVDSVAADLRHFPCSSPSQSQR